MIHALLKTCALVISLLFFSTPAQAQDVPLVPFSDSNYALQGMIPDGWTSAGMGIYTRASSPTDLTLLALQSALTSADNLWASLLPQFALDAVPEPTGTRQNAAFTWTLYQIDVSQSDLTLRLALAVAEQDGAVYLALLQAAPDEFDALYSGVFLPVLDSLAPLELTTEPLPYVEEDVSFTNGDVTLAGTLTLPDSAGRHPAVVLMSGSGSQDRDEMVVPGFRIFRLIADHLTRQGIAVLRYDDRGVGRSSGDFESTSIAEFASDGAAAVAYLKTRDDIDPDQVGLIGHSEGGMYAAMLGANPDSGVAFIVALAGTAVPGGDLLRHQNRLILEASGASPALVDSQLALLDAVFPLIVARDWDAVEQRVYEATLAQWQLLTAAERTAVGGDAEQYARQLAANARQGWSAEWFPTVLEYDPAPDWAQTTVPVLAIFGGKDVQVDDVQNAPPLTQALAAAGNRDFTVVVLPNANHLFQEAVTGATSEYLQLPTEFTPDLLPTLSDWLLRHVTLAS